MCANTGTSSHNNNSHPYVRYCIGKLNHCCQYIQPTINLHNKAAIEKVYSFAHSRNEASAFICDKLLPPQLGSHSYFLINVLSQFLPVRSRCQVQWESLYRWKPSDTFQNNDNKLGAHPSHCDHAHWPWKKHKGKCCCTSHHALHMLYSSGTFTTV